MNVVELSFAERYQLAKLMAETTTEYTEQDFRPYLARCLGEGGQLPERLVSALATLSQPHLNEGFLLIRNLPLPDMGFTPLSRRKTISDSGLNRTKHLKTLINSQIGIVYTFDSKQNQDHVESIFPIREDANRQINSNSDFLEWHVEDGFHPLRADFVSLLCLRGDPDAFTYICPMSYVDLADDVLDTLTQPRYLIQVDDTFNQMVARLQFKTSVFDSSQRNEVVYDPSYMSCLDPEAERAFRLLGEQIQAKHLAIALKAGDMLIFDNKKVVHARSPYSPRYDGTDRWLLRSLMLDSVKDASLLGTSLLANSGVS
ncbi:MAG: TauD/TfdA family dioxygenase [Pseudomonas sp.]|uniref:TauD/TfdA family dioxygenase n=1 Tax=Pseudomonas sp. TaxID=306 RepID=UPI0033942740